MMRAALVRLVSFAFLVGVATGAALPAGCASRATKFYVLTPVASAAPKPSDARGDVVIGVGPIELPHYLDRPQIVRRTPGSELEVAEFSQWAEPLQDGFARALAENLARLVPTERVVLFPWRRADAIGYQVVVRVVRFEADTTGEAHLEARWSLVDEEAKEKLVTRRSIFTEAVDRGDHRAVVRAMSAALRDLSQEIAAEMRALSTRQAAPDGARNERRTSEDHP